MNRSRSPRHLNRSWFGQIGAKNVAESSVKEGEDVARAFLKAQREVYSIWHGQLRWVTRGFGESDKKSASFARKCVVTLTALCDGV